MGYSITYEVALPEGGRCDNCQYLKYKNSRKTKADCLLFDTWIGRRRNSQGKFVFYKSIRCIDFGQDEKRIEPMIDVHEQHVASLQEPVQTGIMRINDDIKQEEAVSVAPAAAPETEAVHNDGGYARYDEGHAHNDEGHTHNDGGYARYDEEHAHNDEGHARNDEGHARNDEGYARYDEGHAHNDEGHAHNDEGHAHEDEGHTHNDEGYAATYYSEP